MVVSSRTAAVPQIFLGIPTALLIRAATTTTVQLILGQRGFPVTLGFGSCSLRGPVFNSFIALPGPAVAPITAGLHQVRTTCLSPPQQLSHHFCPPLRPRRAFLPSKAQPAPGKAGAIRPSACWRAAPVSPKAGTSLIPPRTKQDRPASSPTRKPPGHAGLSLLGLSRDCSTGTPIH
jgi:hypothetical protein